MKYVVNNGKKTRFWHHVWIRECPFLIAFCKIYEICNQQHWTVHQVLHEGMVNLTFRRALGEEELIEWEEC
jgi:hypothetical protein